jgi:predicted ATP-grasp superfamily ATP-dependent carboligase
MVLALCRQLEAKELISIEGIGSSAPAGEPKSYYYSTDPKIAKKMDGLGYECIGEAIIVGVTAALLQKQVPPMACIFAETKSNLPDSRAAANVVKMLDKYLGLKVDYGPLLKQAEEFEKRLKVLLERVAKAKEEKEEKSAPYIG